MTNDVLSASGSGFAVLLPLVPLIAKLSILLVAASVIHAALGRKRVLIRSGLWNAVLVAAILLPLACLSLPRHYIGWVRADEFTENWPEVISAVASNDASSGSLNNLDLKFEPSRLTLPERSQPGRSDPIRTDTWPSVSAIIMKALVGIYAVGVILLSIRLVASLLAVARLKRGTTAVGNHVWTESLSRWCDRLRVARSVSLVKSDHVRVPLLLGWLRPAIVISCDDEHATSMEVKQVDSILVHELAHLQRRDDAWNLIQQLVQILYWPHPMIWWAGRLIGGVREQACDDLCVMWVGDADAYRDALVGVAARLVRGRTAFVPMSLGLAITRNSSSVLLHRLSWIGQTEGVSSPVLRWPGRLMVAVLVLAAAGSLSTIELSRAGAVLAEDVIARAYQQPAPDGVKFHTVTLTVLDDETSKPLADTEVMVLNYVDLKGQTFRTDTRGRLIFEYPYMGSVPTLNVELRKNGYVPIRHYWGPGPDPSPAVDALNMRLRRGTTMGGIVVHRQDQPLEGVTVVMTVSGYGSGKRTPNPTGYEIYYEVPSVTGRDGRWRTDSVPPGAETVSLQLIHPDFVCDGCTTLGNPGRSPKLEALRNQTDRQVMLKGVKVTGRVIDGQDRPVAGAQVIDSTRGMTFLTYIQHAFTDVDGRFHLHLPHNGKVSLTVTAKRLAPVTIQVAAELGAPPLEIRMSEGRTLRARIVDPDGKPLAGASVIIPSIGKHRGVWLRRWSDRDGRFSWDSAPAEQVAFAIGAEGYESQRSVELAADDKDAVVVLVPEIDVRLRAIDAVTGEPVSRFAVRVGAAGQDDPKLHWRPISSGNAQGEYNAAIDTTKRPFRFEVSADGYETVETRTFQGAERKVREVVRLNKKKP